MQPTDNLQKSIETNPSNTEPPEKKQKTHIFLTISNPPSTPNDLSPFTTFQLNQLISSKNRSHLKVYLQNHPDLIEKYKDLFLNKLKNGHLQIEFFIQCLANYKGPSLIDTYKEQLVGIKINDAETLTSLKAFIQNETQHLPKTAEYYKKIGSFLRPILINNSGYVSELAATINLSDLYEILSDDSNNHQLSQNNAIIQKIAPYLLKHFTTDELMKLLFKELPPCEPMDESDEDDDLLILSDNHLEERASIPERPTVQFLLENIHLGSLDESTKWQLALFTFKNDFLDYTQTSRVEDEALKQLQNKFEQSDDIFTLVNFLQHCLEIDCSNKEIFDRALKLICHLPEKVQLTILGRMTELIKLPLQSVLNYFGEETLEKLTPYMYYLNLYNFSKTSIARHMISSCTNRFTLKIYKKESIEALDQISNCTDFEADGISKLPAFPSFPDCKRFQITLCHDLETSPPLPLCKEFVAKQCNQLMSTQALPHCSHFWIENCPELITIGNIETCVDFICEENKKLKKLPALTNCNIVRINNCNSIKKIPANVNSYIFEISHCSALEGFDSSSFNCVSFKCESCPKIRSFPKLPLCEKFISYDNLRLRYISELPKCYSFFCKKCHQLEQIPVLCDNAHFQIDKFIILEQKTLPQKPLSALRKLKGYLLNHLSFPKVRLKDNGRLLKTEDVDGVKRDLVSIIFENLFKKATDDVDFSEHLLIDEEGYPITKEEYSPHHLSESARREMQDFNTIGLLFKLCYEDLFSLKTGCNLPLKLYECIILPEYEIELPKWELKCVLCLKGAPKSLYSLAQIYKNPVHFNQRDYEWVQTFVEELLPEVALGQNTIQTFLLDETNRRLLANALVAQIHTPKGYSTNWIRKGAIDGYTEASWKQICDYGPEDYQECVEGSINISDLEQLVVYGYPENANEEDRMKLTNYFKNWISTTTSLQLRHFIRIVTGLNCLNNQIIVSFTTRTDIESYPVIHVCTNTIEISSKYPSQEHFDKKMNDMIEEIILAGFQEY